MCVYTTLYLPTLHTLLTPLSIIIFIAYGLEGPRKTRRAIASLMNIIISFLYIYLIFISQVLLPLL